MDNLDPPRWVDQLLGDTSRPRYCEHCSSSADHLPGWKHDVRAADEGGTVEHLWWAIFSEGGVRFACGVSVKRNAQVDSHFSDRPLIVWKAKPVDSSLPVEGVVTDVVSGAMRMVGAEGDTDSLIKRWAQTLARQLQPKPSTRKYSPALTEEVPF